MSVIKKLLEKGMKYMLYALPLMFIGPSVIYNAFINKDNVWHYLVLGIGIALCLMAVYFMYKGIKTLTDALFENDK
jgi:drug/metabolite transporter (DMT)-like permease